MTASEQATSELADGEVRARRAYEGSKRRYDAGLDDLASTLNAEQGWRSVRSTLTAERVASLRHAVQTYKALGGGWVYTASASGS